MVRRSTYPVSLVFYQLVTWLSILSANAQCLSTNKLQLQLTEINQKPTSEQIALLSHLEGELQRHNCPDTIYALVLQNFGKSYYDADKFDLAIKKFQKSIAVSRQLTSHSNIARLVESYFYMGICYQFSQNRPKAISCYTNCVRLGKQYDVNHEIVGHAFSYLSFIHQETGDYQQALTMAEHGVYYAHQANNKVLEARCLYEKARDLMLLGYADQALSVIENAIQLVKNNPKAIENAVVFTILKAQIARRVGKPDVALALYNQVLDYYQHQNKGESIAHVYGSIGNLYLEAYKDYSKAISYSQLAYDAYTNPYEKARMLNNIGLAYLYTKQWTKALNACQEALLILPINFHKATIQQNPPAEAIRLSAYKEYLLTLMQHKADTWLAYAKVSGNHLHLRYALDTYKVADQMIDLMRWEHTGHQSKLFWRQKTRGMYECAIETCYRLGDTEQAFRFMEKSRAVMLADKLNELGAKRQLSPKQAAEEKRLHKRVSERQAEITTLTPDSIRYEPTRMALNACQDSLNSFLKELEQSNPAYYRYKYDNATPSLAELQGYLTKQGSSLVTYFVGDSALYLMAISGGKSILKKQPIGPYTQALKQFAPLLATAEAMRKTSEVNRYLILSNSLYQQLLAPLDLPKGRVIVSPDGFFIPFDALSRSASQPHYLVADYAFSYVYSARLLLKNQAPDRQITGFRTYDFLGIAPVDFAPSLGQVMLPNSDAALTLIGKRFRSAKLLTHETATREAFLSKASTARIIHLFTHAVADSTDQEPKLYFADSTLKLSDLSDGALPNAKLIVLAACKTGIGANQRGEGVFSLARGFAALGVPSVLTTLWSVENEATYRLTDLFYTYLDQGLTKDIALQRAKQDWLKTAEGAGQLPNYWAGLIIVGDAEPMVTNFVGLWVILPILILISVGWWLWRKRKQQSQAYILAPKEV